MINNKYIDLHAHLDGSITVDIAKRLAQMQNIDLPTNNDDKLLKLLSVPEDCGSLNDFLKCFELPLTLLQTKEALSEAVILVAKKMKSCGVAYAELRFAPQLHLFGGMTQENAVEAALNGLKQADIPVNLILCCMRGEKNDRENAKTVELAKKYLVKSGGVVAIDLAGAEALYPTEKYKELLQRAAECGIPLTVHAGEADGAQSVKAAIESGAVRIGHGVRIEKNDDVMRLVKEKGIVLEMCPTSNRLTRAVENMSDYPLLRFLEYGIKVTVNTDDMAIERTDIANEFRYAKTELGITDIMAEELLKNAVDGAFTDDETKRKLRKNLNLQ